MVAIAAAENRLISLHENSRDHIHVSSGSANCTDKTQLNALDSRFRGCEAYAGGVDCGRYDTLEFTASALCCACGGGRASSQQVSGWVATDAPTTGRRIIRRSEPQITSTTTTSSWGVLANHEEEAHRHGLNLREQFC